MCSCCYGVGRGPLPEVSLEKTGGGNQADVRHGGEDHRWDMPLWSGVVLWWPELTFWLTAVQMCWGLMERRAKKTRTCCRTCPSLMSGTPWCFPKTGECQQACSFKAFILKRLRCFLVQPFWHETFFLFLFKKIFSNMKLMVKISRTCL